MSDELDLLEKQLKQIQPRKLSGSLKGRITSELDNSVRLEDKAVSAGWQRSWAWSYAGLAAAVMVALGSWYTVVHRISPVSVQNADVVSPKSGTVDLGHRADVPPSDGRVTAPGARSEKGPELDSSMAVDTVLLQTTDEGIALDEDSKPVRKMRYKLLDTVQWDEPGDKSKYQTVSMRDVVAYMPVRMD